ncbi:DegT/DnrJ/EryC1/StrS family aminotransferase [Aerococcus urinaeequi]|uniref:DegT/DnrJ/EryC1/StrS family aminotransferase n=1 Tax=Aerococcus urinaeequi TaxID=51665 RepID=UPI0022E5D4CC|nr:DegT/DnrJ/EryC1/StrS family aminotransferase [Aerococcus urinaeequi]
MSDEGYEREFAKEAFDKNWIAPLGENVDKFEKELAEMIDIDHALALSSGTAAIHLALKAVGVGSDDIVFCQDLTFVATANPILYQDATPVFIDSENETWNMDPEALEEAFEKYSPKAVLLVHLYGKSAKIDQIKAICKKRNVPLIEDAAESLGTLYKNQWTGTFGDYGIFSFNGNKIITTSGGGMLVSNNEQGIVKAKYWATQAREPVLHYEHREIGYNYRLSNVSAGIGRGQLKVLADRIEQKNEIFNRYKEAFIDINEIIMLDNMKDERPNHWLSTMLIDSESITPEDVINALSEANIEARPIWKPMHSQPVFAGFDYIGKGNSSIIYKNGLCLPSDTKMTISEQQIVIDVIRNIWRDK